MNSKKLQALSEPLAGTELDGLLATPGGLETWAQSVDVGEAYGLIKKFGLDDCAALIHVLPAQKLLAILDLDVWSRHSHAKEDKLDKEQLLCWLKTLLYAGAEHTVQVLCELGVEFSAGAFAHYVEHTPMEVYAFNRAETGLGVEDKDVEHGDALELGIYCGSFVRLKETESLDEVEEVFLELLGGLEEHAPEFLTGVFHHISAQESNRIVREDFKLDRAARLEGQGFTPSLKAREFLLRTRTAKGLRGSFPGRTRGAWKGTFWQAYYSAARQEEPSGERVQAGAPEGSTALQKSGEGYSAGALLSLLFGYAQSQDPLVTAVLQDELAWLGNLLAGGWNLKGCPMAPEEAVHVVHATLQLGLELCVNHASPDVVSPTGISDVFEIGWQALHRNVVNPVAVALDERIRARTPENQELRECWTLCCQRYNLKEASFVKWLGEGRYHQMHQVLVYLEYVLTPHVVFWARCLLDDTPQLPAEWESGIESKKSNQHACYFSSPRMFAAVGTFKSLLTQA